MPDKKILGNTEPRVFTAPLRDLDEPDASLGPYVVDVADRLGIRLLPWQYWWVMHALELTPSGLRFQVVLTRTGRQNGRTELFRLVALTLMIEGLARRVYGVGHSRAAARESLFRLVDLAAYEPSWLRSKVKRVSRANGNESLTLTNRARYEIGSARPRGGHRLSVADLLIVDNGLLDRVTWDEWPALVATTMHAPEPLILGSYNSEPTTGDVLDVLRSDSGTGVFNWSAEPGTEPDSLDGWAAANPALGYTLSEAALRKTLKMVGPDIFSDEHL